MPKPRKTQKTEPAFSEYQPFENATRLLEVTTYELPQDHWLRVMTGNNAACALVWSVYKRKTMTRPECYGPTSNWEIDVDRRERQRRIEARRELACPDQG